jgi:hypothetical protein
VLTDHPADVPAARRSVAVSADQGCARKLTVGSRAQYLL